MQSEEFDNKIKEAAEHHHPAYDEQAWGRMNTLLDKHLPVKEERRRRFAWLFFLLFLLGGAGVFYGIQSLVTSKPAKKMATDTIRDTMAGNEVKGKDATGNLSDVKTLPENNETEYPRTEQSVIASDKSNNPGLPAEQSAPAKRKVNQQQQALNKTSLVKVSPGNRPQRDQRKSASLDQRVNNAVSPDFQSGVAKKQMKTKKAAVSGDPQKNITSDPDRNNIVKEGSADPNGNSTAKAQAIALPENEKISKATTSALLAEPKKEDSLALKSDNPPAADPVQKNKPAVIKKKSQFYLTLSAGPDASFTKDGKPGRIVPVTGAGIGYTYRERFSIRAGFYNATKIYGASPAAYNAPAIFYNYYPYLVKVEANCRVYEIPVSLGYHFAARKNHSWFASASISSYLMKRETYDYSYKSTAWGPVQQREWTIRNRNEHWFSVLGLSGGYQRKITNRISFIAEPYLRMPFNGVGYGKVKLRSTGVLFSLAIQPAAFIPHKQKK